MSNIEKVAAKIHALHSSEGPNVSKVIAKMKADALVHDINFRFGFSRLVSGVLELRWAEHIYRFEGFQPSRQALVKENEKLRETLVKENAKLPWAKVLYQHDAFRVVPVNPFPAVGPKKGGHFRALMEKKCRSLRFDRLLERNAVKRILQPAYFDRFDDSEASKKTAWESQTNKYWENTRLNLLRAISRPVLETHIKCLAPFEEDAAGVWVRTEMTRAAIVKDMVTVMRWVEENKLAEHEKVQDYQKLANEMEADLKAKNPDTYQTPVDKRNMVDAMKACIHRDSNEKRWATEATEDVAATEAARVAKKEAKAAKNARGKRK